MFPSKRLIRITEWLFLLVTIGYAGGRALPRAWQRLNTDFPNYYITAHLLREGIPSDRAYEWIWFQRQKDHLGITREEQPLVGFVPHTPFSALLLEPLTFWSPLVAKRLWIGINLVLLAGVALLLRALTQLAWRRLALLIGLCYPLLRNFEYGQYYLVVLLLITASLYLFLKGKNFAAGAAMGIAAGLKIFPAFFLLYFLRKRDFRAAIGLLIGAACTVLGSLAAFGLQLHRTYLTQVLPWAMRGEAQDPYNLASNSISSLLHKLFFFEPEWNPHPVLHAPLALAVLQPLLTLVVLVPAIYIALPGARQSKRVQLEWSAFLVALLAISALPASYHFTLLILPVTLLAAFFLRECNFSSLMLLLLLYIAICFPVWPRIGGDGWMALTAVPRLYFLILLLVLCCTTLCWLGNPGVQRNRDRSIWVTALVIAFVAQVFTGLRHQRALDGYAGRIQTDPDILLATEPIIDRGELSFVAMLPDRYAIAATDAGGTHLPGNAVDQLSHAANDRTYWIEQSSRFSNVIRDEGPASTPMRVQDAESPALSQGGRWLAYLRAVKGENTLWLHSAGDAQRADVAVTGPGLNVEEVTFLPDDSLMFAAAKAGRHSALYAVSLGAPIQLVDETEIRFPSASPDGQWLAYSQMEDGVWNLWVRNLRTQASRRITAHDCNDISPAWEPDSKTLLYASDCGRAFWFTALYRRQIIP